MISREDIEAMQPDLPPVIGLAGAAGSGKSTAAEQIAIQLYPDVARVRFADPLKAMMRALYDTAGLSFAETDRRIEGDLKQAFDPLLLGHTPRLAMQTLGTEWGRYQFGGDFWTRLWMRRASLARSTTPGVIVVAEDVRFREEVRAVREMGGVIIGLAGRGGIGGAHESERSLGGADLDAVVMNGPDLSPKALGEAVINAARWAVAARPPQVAGTL